MGIEHFPRLHYPELYVIQGGYQAFFQAGYTQFCQPADYVSMLDRRFSKEYNENWRLMKRSSSVTSASFAVRERDRERERERNTQSPCSMTPAAGGALLLDAPGSGSRILSRRVSRTRSWTEMDSPQQRASHAFILPCHSHVPFSPLGLQPRTLDTSGLNQGSTTPTNLTNSLNHVANGPPSSSSSFSSSSTNTASSSACSASSLARPRVSRGLSLTLDSAAASHASTSGGIAIGVTRRSSAFSYASSPSSTPTSVASSTSSYSHNTLSSSASTASIHHPPLNSFHNSFTPNFASGAFSPSLTPTSAFFASSFGTGPSPSPSPSYGWSTEGRSDTPSPFHAGDSPRMASSLMSPSASSPVPMWITSPALPPHAAPNTNINMSHGMNSVAHTAATVASTLAVEDSPRAQRTSSNSASLLHPTYSAAMGGNDQLLKPSLSMMNMPVYSPKSRHTPTVVDSPSSALNGMHLRSTTPVSHHVLIRTPPTSASRRISSPAHAATLSGSGSGSGSGLGPGSGSGLIVRDLLMEDPTLLPPLSPLLTSNVKRELLTLSPVVASSTVPPVDGDSIIHGPFQHMRDTRMAKKLRLTRDQEVIDMSHHQPHSQRPNCDSVQSNSTPQDVDVSTKDQDMTTSEESVIPPACAENMRD